MHRGLPISSIREDGKWANLYETDFTAVDSSKALWLLARDYKGLPGMLLIQLALHLHM